jgi:hypothetical protein
MSTKKVVALWVTQTSGNWKTWSLGIHYQTLPQKRRTNMTPEETREAAQLMLDWADQQFDVQSKPLHWARGWIQTDGPRWNWHEFEYRRKPTPKLRPYTAEECVGLVGREVVGSAAWAINLLRVVDLGRDLQPRHHSVHAAHIYPNCVSFSVTNEAGVSFTLSAHELLENYKFDDGSPCGVEEE